MTFTADPFFVTRPDRLVEAGTWAGYRSAHFARTTGTLVVVVNAVEQGLEDGSDREVTWMTICDDHGSCVGHRTRRLAAEWAPHPEGWCGGCREITKATEATS